MSHGTLNPRTLRDAWVLYEEHLLQQNARQIRSLVKTALFRYTLPGYGLPAAADDAGKLAFMAKISLTSFVDALNIQQQYFDDIQEPKYRQRTNRHRLKQMLDWCSAQPWWSAATEQTPGSYCPRRRQNLGNAHHVKTSKRRNVSRYSLQNLKPEKEPNLSAEEKLAMSFELERIERELQQLCKFLTGANVYKRQGKAMRPPTWNKTLALIKLIYGWLYFYEKIPLQSLSLKLLDDTSLAYDYAEWLRVERGNSPKSEVQGAVAFLNVAKFNHHKQSDQSLCERLSKTYYDIDIITELRRLVRDINVRVKSAPVSTADESKKWLKWPEYLACVEFLRKDCNPFTSDGDSRTPRAIARSYERYLLAALLGYVPPDRQRTFRELVLGRSLVKGRIEQQVFFPDPQGEWFISLEADDYKTGETYGQHRLKIPEVIYPILEEWLEKWRGVLNPKHEYVFTQLNGNPLTSESLYQLFRHAIYRASVNLFGEGKAPNPHLIRDMLVTYCYEIGASEAQMDGLALAMKHSRKTQRERYDRRSQQQKMQPALDLMETFTPSE